MLGIAGQGFVHHGAHLPARRQRNAKALHMDALCRHAASDERGLGLVVHLERAADEGFVDPLCRNQRLEELRQLFAVDKAHVQRRVGLLGREHVVQHQAREVAVLEVFDLLLEHRGLQRAVAVDQGEAAVRLARQHGLHDGQDGRDAAAARNAQVMPVRRRLKRHEEAALRRHHLQCVAHLEPGVDPVGKHAAADFAHAHAQLVVVHTGADGVRAAQVLPVNVGAQREVLALGEAEHLAQVGWHVERDDDRLRRVRLDRAHAQGVEDDAHGWALLEGRQGWWWMFFTAV